MSDLDRSLIAGLPHFAGLSSTELDRILTVGRSSRYPKDSEFFAQGEEARSFFLLLSGHVRVAQTSPAGDQIVARYINEGEWFGIAVAMGLKTYPATAVAAIDCVAIAWPNTAWADFQMRYPAFGVSVFETIGSRLAETQARVMQMSSDQVEQRIASTMLRLVNQAGRKVADGIEIDFPITRQEIAEMTGTTLYTVSRTLRSWEEQGLVRGGRQKVTVTDPHGLLLVAENRVRR